MNKVGYLKGFGKCFDYNSIRSLKPISDIFAQDRVILRIGSRDSQVRTILIGKKEFASTRPLKRVWELDEIINTVQNAIDNPKPRPAAGTTQQAAINIPASPVKEGEEAAEEEEEFEDIFEGVGVMSIVPENVSNTIRPRKTESEAIVQKVESIIAGASSRLERAEAEEAATLEATRILLEDVTEIPTKIVKNPFSIAEASLVPLKNKPVSSHHIGHSVVQRLVREGAMENPDRLLETLEEDYEIDLEGEDVVGNNTSENPSKKRPRHEARILEDVKTVVDAASKIKGASGANG